MPWSWAVERLERSRNYWIITTRPDSRPHAVPVWGVWHDGAVLFGTSPSTVKARNLERNPRLVVHLESGDEVVILEGTAEQVTADESVADAYEAKYQHRPSVEGLWLVRPTRAFAWTESDYPDTATRFDWD